MAPYEFPENVPKILPVIKISPVGYFVFPGVTFQLELTPQEVTTGYLAKFKETPYAIVSPQMPDVSGPALLAFGTLVRVTKIKEHKQRFMVEFYGFARARLTRVENPEGFFLAHWTKIEPESVPPEMLEGEETRSTIGTLQELFRELMGRVTGKKFFKQKLVKRTIQQVEEADPGNADETIDGIMNMLNAIRFRKDGRLTNLAHPFLLIFRQTNVLERLGSTVQLLHVLVHGMPPDEEETYPKQATHPTAPRDPSKNRNFTERYAAVKNNMPEEARKEVAALLGRFQGYPRESESIAERLEWILFLPWIEETSDPTDLTEMERLLGQKHAGLKKAKERIAEFVAGRMINPAGEGSIICFVGPPGTGKTSFAYSIGHALGRKCVSLNLGDLEDSKELVGFHQTYYKAAPGALMMLVKRAGTRNPVVVLDEVDKLNRWKGNPAAVLLEILDPEQNHQFRDHYLNVPFDLSRVLFITTANILDTIPPALRDRMEIIEFPGYTPSEKLEIAKNHLVARRRQKRSFPIALEGGREPIDITFTDDALLELIHHYVKEAGVRDLEREIDKPFRRIARRIKSEDTTLRGVIEITVENLSDFCGKPKIESGYLPDILPPGTVPVLAVSETGGELFMVEITVNRHPGKRKIATKGVRPSGESKDSTNIIADSVEKEFDALTARGKLLHDRLKELEEQLGAPIILGGNVTNGAIPKDGPSAGLSIFLAIYGALTDQSVKPTPETPLLAATGQAEVNLDTVGKIGGLRDKLFVAERQGVKLCFVPQANAADLEDIPDEIKSEVRIIPVANRLEALAIAYPRDREKIFEFLENSNRSSS